MARVKTLSVLAVVVALVMAYSPVYFGQGQSGNNGQGNPAPGCAPVNLVAPLPLPFTGTVEVTGVSSIAINTPATNPVLTRDVDVTAREPFQVRTPFSLFSSGLGNVT